MKKKKKIEYNKFNVTKMKQKIKNKYIFYK